MTGLPVRFGFSTLERWFYAVRAGRSGRRAAQPPTRRSRAPRTLHRRRSRPSRAIPGPPAVDVPVALRQSGAVVLGGDLPSYATVRRHIRQHGLLRKSLRRANRGRALAAERLEQREVRSFEVDHVAPCGISTSTRARARCCRDGRWVKPMLLGVLDDCSRLVCHAQWYLEETAESLVHGLWQAMQKRGLPRALMTDNGAAMLAGEIQRGSPAWASCMRPPCPTALPEREAGSPSGAGSRGA